MQHRSNAVGGLSTGCYLRSPGGVVAAGTRILAAKLVRDELLDRDEAEAVPPCHAAELVPAGHGPVLAQDLADDASRVESRQTGEIDGRLGLASPPEHPTRVRPKGEDMPRTAKVGGLGARVHEKLDRARAIVRGDAGRDPEAAVRVDRDGEGGAVRIGVAVGHRVEG